MDGETRLPTEARALRIEVGKTASGEGFRDGSANKDTFGGEVSAHYSFRDNCYADSGFIAFVIMLQLLSNYEQPLSEIVKPFNKYFKAADINIEVKDKDAVLVKVKEKYDDGKQDFLDG